MNNEKIVMFSPPKGFVPPEGTERDFDMVCSFRIKDDGSLCLTKLGDTEMPGYDKSESPMRKPDYSETAKEMQAAANQRSY